MNEIKLQVLSLKKNIQIVRNIIGIILVDKNPTMSFINEIKTVTSEAITNAIVHGYEGSEDKMIDINVNIYDDAVKIVIEDKGIGIKDIEEAKTPLFSSKKDDERSGLGFTIMEIFSDEFNVESEVGVGTKVTIIKKWINHV